MLLQVGPTPESNSNFKCIMGPKRFWVKKGVGSQIILVPKKFWVKNSVSTKIILVAKKLGPRDFVSKKCRVQKYVGFKNSSQEKNFGSKIIFGLSKFGSKNIGFTKILRKET